MPTEVDQTPIDVPPLSPSEEANPLSPSEEANADVEGGATAERERVRVQSDPDLQEHVVISAFGQRLTIKAPKFQFLRSDSLWRLRNIYQPALATQTLSTAGVAIDIGAGFGAFTLPFAMAFPDWKVFSFEPDMASFSILQENIKALGVRNVTALPVAVGCSASDAPEDPEHIGRLMRELLLGTGQDLNLLVESLPQADYSFSVKNPGYVERGRNPSHEYEVKRAPTLAASMLEMLSPSLLKLIAPGVESGIVADLSGAALDHLIGESWFHISSLHLHSASVGLRQTWIPRAGQPMLSLRRSLDQSGRQSRLDVVVNMRNAEDSVLSCVSSILEGSVDQIRAIVVDDGSTDDSFDVVLSEYKSDTRVTLLRKPHGGSASARNFGRLHSDAANIAFVDADGLPGPGFFLGLLDLSRQTGAEAVQGGYHLLAEELRGDHESIAASELAEELFLGVPVHDLGDIACRFLPGHILMQGRPSIWRRVFRRDFLDNRNIWFPEHLKDFGDQFFQMRTLQSCVTVPMLSGISYGHRRLTGSALTGSSQEAFSGLETFRLVLKSGLQEGWNDFRPILRQFREWVNRTSRHLESEERVTFVQGAAEVWVYARKALGSAAFDDLPESCFEPLDFSYYCGRLLDRLSSFGDSYSWAYFDGLGLQSRFVKLMSDG